MAQSRSKKREIPASRTEFISDAELIGEKNRVVSCPAYSCWRKLRRNSVRVREIGEFGLIGRISAMLAGRAPGSSGDRGRCSRSGYLRAAIPSGHLRYSGGGCHFTREVMTHTNLDAGWWRLM